METFRFVFILMAVIAGVWRTNAQSLDAEIGFIYVKAEYLFETGRYDEAITSYNQVISLDSMYKDALIHRGQAKYALAAYAGAKLDAMRSIELKGVSHEASALLGRSFSARGNYKAAVNSFSAAIALEPKRVEYFEWRAEAYERDGQKSRACKDYEAAMNLGSAAGEQKSRALCGWKGSQPVSSSAPPAGTKVQTPVSPSAPAGSQEEDMTEQNNPATEPPAQVPVEVLEGQTVPTETAIPDDSEPPADNALPVEDLTVNKIDIDDDLYIEISGQGLGKRVIAEVPSILILPDEAGKVTVNICVNKAGRVVTAEYNGELSTINKKSLVMFAIRKAQEFEFSMGEYDSQCGIMIFHILNK